MKKKYFQDLVHTYLYSANRIFCLHQHPTVVFGQNIGACLSILDAKVIYDLNGYRLMRFSFVDFK